MSSGIYRLWTGRHIDLDRLLSVSDAYFSDRMGYGGYFVGFELHFQLMDKPLVLEFAAEVVWLAETEIIDRKYKPRRTEDGDVVDRVELQARVDELVAAWPRRKAERGEL